MPLAAAPRPARPAAAAPRPAGHTYRRSRTTTAPRKRTALLMFSNHGSLAHPPAAARRGDAPLDGPSGPGGLGGGAGGFGGRGGSGGWRGGSGGDGGAPGRRPSGGGAAAAAAVAVALGAAALAGAAGRRLAGADADGASWPAAAAAALALPGLAGAGGAVVIAGEVGGVLPGPSRLTRREIMLYDPPQYRVRDTIYIH
jgi:hypothetical protein